MSDRSLLLRGKVKNGVVVPTDGTILPEGADVEFEVLPYEFTPEERAEFQFWRDVSLSSVALIDKWEREGIHERG